MCWEGTWEMSGEGRSRSGCRYICQTLFIFIFYPTILLKGPPRHLILHFSVHPNPWPSSDLRQVYNWHRSKQTPKPLGSLLGVKWKKYLLTSCRLSNHPPQHVAQAPLKHEMCQGSGGRQIMWEGFPEGRKPAFPKILVLRFKYTEGAVLTWS